MLGRDEIANMAVRDAHEIVGFVDSQRSQRRGACTLVPELPQE